MGKHNKIIKILFLVCLIGTTSFYGRNGSNIWRILNFRHELNVNWLVLPLGIFSFSHWQLHTFIEKIFIGGNKRIVFYYFFMLQGQHIHLNCKSTAYNTILSFSQNVSSLVIIGHLYTGWSDFHGSPLAFGNRKIGIHCGLN